MADPDDPRSRPEPSDAGAPAASAQSAAPPPHPPATTAPAAEPPSDGTKKTPLAHPSTLEASIESIRQTTKWIMAALGAIATVLVGGLQLTDLPRSGTWPFYRSVFGLSLAVMGILTALYLAAQVLSPLRFGIGALDDAAHRPHRWKRIVGSRRYVENWASLPAVASFINGHPDLLLIHDDVADLYRERQQLLDLVGGLKRFDRRAVIRDPSRRADAAPPVARSGSDEPGPTTVRLPAIEPEHLSLLGLDEADLANAGFADSLDLARWICSEAEGLTDANDSLIRQIVEIARYELTRRRFNRAMRVLGVAAIFVVVGVATFASSVPAKADDAKEDDARCCACPVVIPGGSFGIGLTQEQIAALNEAGNQLDLDKVISLVEGITDVALTNSTNALTALETLGPKIIETLGSSVLKPVIDGLLDDGGPPAGWSVVIRLQLQYRFRSQGFDPEVAARLVDLLVEAIEGQVGRDPGAGGSAGAGGDSTVSQDGPTIVIINQVDGRVTTVVPGRTG